MHKTQSDMERMCREGLLLVGYTTRTREALNEINKDLFKANQNKKERYFFTLTSLQDMIYVNKFVWVQKVTFKFYGRNILWHPPWFCNSL